jgi:hypothetical protein
MWGAMMGVIEYVGRRRRSSVLSSVVYNGSSFLVQPNTITGYKPRRFPARGPGHIDPEGQQILGHSHEIDSKHKYTYTPGIPSFMLGPELGFTLP